MSRSLWLVILSLLLPQAASARHHHHRAAAAAVAAKPAGEGAAKPAGEGAAKPAGDDDEAADAARPWWPPTATVGPAKVALAGQATLDLPQGYVFLGKADSKAFMERIGNRVGDSDLGILLPQDLPTRKFFVTVNWDAAGYVKDDEADKLKPGEILDTIRKGTEEANAFRKERGFAPIQVVGWGEPPRYERAAHHIVWAVIGQSQSREPGSDTPVPHQTVNFNTRLLGRGGYLSLNLICSVAQLGDLKPTMTDLLGRVAFDSGHRYADFTPGKDKVAEFGLAALIVGGAAVAGKTALKVGLLAKFGKVLLGLLLAFKKGLVLLLLGLGALIKRLFTGKRSDAEEGKPAAPQDGPTP